MKREYSEANNKKFLKSKNQITKTPKIFVKNKYNTEVEHWQNLLEAATKRQRQEK